MSFRLTSYVFTLCASAAVVAGDDAAQLPFGVKLSDPVPLHANAHLDVGHDYGNQIASMGNGRWMSFARSNEPVSGQYGDDFDILIAHSDDGGNHWTWPDAVNTDAPTDAGHDRGPQMTTDGLGRWALVWYRGELEESFFDHDVYLATSMDDGATWSNPLDLISAGSNDGANDDHPQIATDAQGRWIVCWTSQNDFDQGFGRDYDVFISVSDDDLGSWSAPISVNTNASSDMGDDRIVQICTDQQGTWVVAWHSDEPMSDLGSDGDILYVRSTDNGTTWSDPQPLNTNADIDRGDDRSVHLATDRSGAWIATWSSTSPLNGRLGNDRDILYAVSVDNGATWSDPTNLNRNAGIDSGTDEVPQIETDTYGNWVATWRSQDDLQGTIGDDWDVLIARSSDLGATWTLPVPVSSRATNDRASDSYGHLATDERGNWIAQWRSADTMGGALGSDWDVMGSRFFIPTREMPVLFVDDDAPAGGDGASWSSAFNDLTDALNVAASFDFVAEIWVAEGVYRPDRFERDRLATFSLVDGVAVYGGFTGQEAQRDQRDPNKNLSILNGDINSRGFNEDNVYHIVTATGNGAGTILDGFTIIEGWADGAWPHDRGAGLVLEDASCQIVDCHFEGNGAFAPGADGVQSGDGGAVYAVRSDAVFERCTFAGNSARRRGGAMFNEATAISVIECQFLGNVIVGGPLGTAGGGAVFNLHGAPTFTDCYFENNSGGDGAAFYNHRSDGLMQRCEFNGNDGMYGGAVYNLESAPNMISSVFRNNRPRRFASRNAGAVFNRDSAPLMINCLLVDNATWRGGAMYNIHSRPVLINCTLANNVAHGNGAALYNLNSRPQFHNCIVWNESDGVDEVVDAWDSITSMRFTNARGGWIGEGNLDIDPRFINTPGVFLLDACSPMIDAGDSSMVPSEILYDVAGSWRRVDDPGTVDTGLGGAPIVDLGAHEFSATSHDCR